jgi:hypothetical protein
MALSKRSPLLFVVLAASVGLASCDQLNNQTNRPPNKAPKPTVVEKESRVPVHRFVLTRNDFNVAFDTQTGQICRTWGWVPLGKPEKPDVATGSAPQRQFGEFSPTCLSLYQQFPSGMSLESESLPDEQPAN